jgi:hypothetical protein
MQDNFFSGLDTVENGDQPVTTQENATLVPTVVTEAPSGLRAADRIAALTAIRDAIDVRLALDKEALTDGLRGATKNQVIPTLLGNLSFKPSTRKPVIDQERLMEYVKQNHPEAVISRVVEEIEPNFLSDITEAITYVGDDLFVDARTGEELSFVYLGDETKPSIAYPASREQKIAKSQARKALAEQFDVMALTLTDAVKELDL